jgi:glucokinase
VTRKRVLAADIGGTKTDIAIFSSKTGIRAPIARATFRNHAYRRVEDLVLEFLEDTHEPVNAACIDVAGPVVDGQAHVTNLPWLVTEEGLKDALHLDAVRLVNDLEATALGCPCSSPQISAR